MVGFCFGAFLQCDTTNFTYLYSECGRISPDYGKFQQNFGKIEMAIPEIFDRNFDKKTVNKTPEHLLHGFCPLFSLRNSMSFSKDQY